MANQGLKVKHITKSQIDGILNTGFKLMSRKPVKHDYKQKHP